jgi:tellurite resistance protein
MSGTTQSAYTSEQVAVWLRGLLTIAWSDGHFDNEEQTLITSVLHQDLTAEERSKALEPIAPPELAQVLGSDPELAENFLRTAVMVALADGVYSTCEDELLEQFCQALGVQTEILQVLRSTLQDLAKAQTTEAINTGVVSSLQPPGLIDHHLDVLHPVRDWLDGMEVHDPKLARFLCKLIPPQCPFERDVKLFGHKIVHIPPMCKLNPLYEQLVGLRFRALSYLADDCGEDISEYC